MRSGKSGDRDDDDQDISEASYIDKQNIFEIFIQHSISLLKSGEITLINFITD